MPASTNTGRPRRPRLLRERPSERPQVPAPAGSTARPLAAEPSLPPRPPWWKRTKPLVTTVATVVGTVSAGLAIWAWVGERVEPPLTVDVDHRTDPCLGWVIAKPPEDLGPVPPFFDAADPGARERWVAGHGGVDSDTSYVNITVQGTSARAVILTGLRIDVVRREPPLAGTTVREQCGDAFWARFFAADLDQDPPAIAPSVDNRQEVEFEGAAPEPIDFPYTVTEGDPELFSLIASTVTCYCEWTATLEWRVGDDTGTSLITDGGEPFRTSATTPVAPSFGNYDGGPLQPLG